ncbi:phosphatidylglycerophosphatase A [Defluviimonas sp. D31]|uniref:phosphatidylglycerophosphatase A family protein n=1 Tax=Defluviimonas sp. D31 TaxID=3083253 RepID=UPI00296F75B5|nr:phosphatidylglycerophosphatase A [Defluviimonas sp. D31]MDW4547779.1 phosphatidylglycerophosphatase A [Defluviimonas sp. D31]
MTFPRLIATWFGTGLLRPAPGTWGSAVAVALGLVIHGIGHFPLLLAATILVIPLGFWATAGAVAGQADKDPSEIVIDEVAGQWIALLFPSAGFWWAGLDSWHFPWPGWVAAFLFFRLFDIWKPGPIGRADRKHTAAGTMEDDLWAGLFAGVATMIAAGLWHGVMRL